LAAKSYISIKFESREAVYLVQGSRAIEVNKMLTFRFYICLTLTIFALVICRSVPAKESLLDKDAKFVGQWESCPYFDNGKVSVYVITSRDNRVELIYEIHGSDVFDGFPYSGKSNIGFDLEFDEETSRAKLGYSFWGKNTLEGNFKLLGPKVWQLRVSDDDLELELKFTGFEILGRYKYLGKKFPFMDRYGADDGIFSMSLAGHNTDAAAIKFECY
jgi:hypothetical protein